MPDRGLNDHRENDTEDDAGPAPAIEAEEARQGEVIFDTAEKRRRTLFIIAALVAILVAGFVIAVP